MILRSYILIIICFFCAEIYSQPENLILNGGFEEFTECPTIENLNQENIFLKQIGWFTPTLGTPDFFNPCCNELILPNQYGCNSPRNARGWQQPRSGDTYGGALLGVFYWLEGVFVSEEKEYLGTNTIRPLTEGKRYCFSTFVSPAEIYVRYQDGTILTYNAAVYSIEVLFKNQTPFFQTNKEIQETPSLILTLPDNAPIDDTLGWTLLRSPYLAEGRESAVIIGCFTNNLFQSHVYLGSALDTSINGTTINQGAAYYYFDDVALVEIEEVSIAESSQELILTRPYTLQATGWAEEYHWSTLENPSNIIATGSPAIVTLSDSTNGFILHARNCEVDQYDTLLVTSKTPPPIYVQGLSINQNAHSEYFKITYTDEQSAPLDVYLFNSAGQLVAQKVITSSHDFSISSYAQGIYFCRIFKDDFPVLTKKIIVR